MIRRTLLALVAGGLAAAIPAAATAVMLWTLVGSPLTATVNQSTTFTLTATNLDLLTELGCLEVDLPASFVIESLGTPTASHGEAWVSNQSSNAVIVRSLSGGGRLEPGWSVTFTIRAHAAVAGTYLWPNHAHQRQDCTSADQSGVPLSVTVLPALIPTPAPTATPAPATPPSATPKPTPTATPILPLPTPTLPLPSLPLPSLPLPSIGLPILTPRPTASPQATPDPTSTLRPTETAEPTATPAPSDGLTIPDGVPSIGGGLPDTPFALTLTRNRGAEAASSGAEVGVELFGLLPDGPMWIVSAAGVVPGLLVILFVVLQAIGALAWIPWVRRMEEERAGPSVSRSG